MKRITQKQWDSIPNDYKSIKNGQCYILEFIEGKGTCSIPVKIVSDLNRINADFAKMDESIRERQAEETFKKGQ